MSPAAEKSQQAACLSDPEGPSLSGSLCREVRHVLERGLRSWVRPRRRRRALAALTEFGFHVSEISNSEEEFYRAGPGLVSQALAPALGKAFWSAATLREGDRDLAPLVVEGWHCWFGEVLDWAAHEPALAEVALGQALASLEGDLRKHPEAGTLPWHRELCLLAAAAQAKVAYVLNDDPEVLLAVSRSLEPAPEEGLPAESAVFLLTAKARLLAKIGQGLPALLRLNLAETLLEEAETEEDASRPRAHLELAAERALTATHLPPGHPARVAAFERLLERLEAMPTTEAPALRQAAHQGLAFSLALTGHGEEALRHLTRARRLEASARREAGRAPLLRAQRREIEGLALRQHHDLDACEKALYAAFRAYRRLGAGLDAGRALLLLTELAQARNQQDVLQWLDALLVEQITLVPELQDYLLARLRTVLGEVDEPGLAAEAERLARELMDLEGGGRGVH